MLLKRLGSIVLVGAVLMGTLAGCATTDSASGSAASTVTPPSDSPPPPPRGGMGH
jgi:hypothetical protein